MSQYAPEPESNGRGRDLLIAGVILALAFSAMFVSTERQEQISNGLQVTVLRPFLGIQQRLATSRLRATQVDSMLVLVDSLSAMLSTHAAVVEENQTLRELLALGERAGARYVPANVLRPGTPGSASMFIVSVGAQDGVAVGSPVIGPFGLVGVIRAVRRQDAVGMDWTHSDFRVSAMLADGSAYGLVQNESGTFLEEDQLILNGIPFNHDVVPGTMVVTSELGGRFPRGIPIGRVRELAGTEGSWRSSYYLDAVVHPGDATHVLVLTGGADQDVTDVWPSDSVALGDSLAGPDTVPGTGPLGAAPASGRSPQP